MVGNFLEGGKPYVVLKRDEFLAKSGVLLIKKVQLHMTFTKVLACLVTDNG